MQAETGRVRQQQLAIEQQRTQQKQLEIDSKREQLDKLAAQQSAARAKEDAWNKFYKKPAKCENVSKQDTLVECGNHYIKEKNKFEGMWANNQLRN